MTLDPGVNIFVTFLLQKIEKCFLSKSCLELALKLKSKNILVTHDTLVTASELFYYLRYEKKFLNIICLRLPLEIDLKKK